MRAILSAGVRRGRGRVSRATIAGVATLLLPLGLRTLPRLLVATAVPAPLAYTLGYALCGALVVGAFSALADRDTPRRTALVAALAGLAFGLLGWWRGSV